MATSLLVYIAPHYGCHFQKFLYVISLRYGENELTETVRHDTFALLPTQYNRIESQCIFPIGKVHDDSQCCNDVSSDNVVML
jgi:hypothetical protein